MDFDPVEKVRAYEAIVEQIERAMQSGQLKVGDRLPPERELVVQFKVSRASVREALRVLESNGLIRSSHGERGAEVVARSTELLSRSVDSVVRFENPSLADLIFFRMLNEGAITGLAATSKTDQDIEHLSKLMDRMRKAAASGGEGFGAADVAFHEAVSDVAGIPLLSVFNSVVREKVQDLIQRKIASGSQKDLQMEDALSRHNNLFNAIAAGKARLAMEISRRNLYEYYAPEMGAKDRERLDILLISPGSMENL